MRIWSLNNEKPFLNSRGTPTGFRTKEMKMKAKIHSATCMILQVSILLFSIFPVTLLIYGIIYGRSPLA